MSQEVEPSVIDYARFYGLIRDHLEHHPLQDFNALDGMKSQQLEDTPDLFQLHLENVQVSEERLGIDAESASLLSSVEAIAKVVPSRNNQDDGIRTNAIRSMKIELPLLRSDHELDMLRFARRIVPDLDNEFLPLETVDEEADEGLTWPSKFYDLPDQYDKKLKSEKLEATSGALRFLQESWDFYSGEEELSSIEVDEAPYQKRTVIEPLSPPLLPLSPIVLPYVPSSETGHLDLLSDHTSPTRDEAGQIERTLFDKDSITLTKKRSDSSSQCSDPMLLECDSLGDIYSPLKGIKDLPSSPPPLRAPLQDRKIEVPLEPAEPEQPPPWKRKTVSFSEALPELIPDLPLPIPRPENVSSSDFDAYLAETIGQIAAKAERTIEQEQLQEEDTMLRVAVPIMDFTLPVAPWKAHIHIPNSEDPENAAKKTLTDMKMLHFSKHIWRMSGKAERDLKWAPFPAALGKVETQESISGNGSLEKYLARPERVDVATLLWKPEGLRILDVLKEDDKEELKEGKFPEEKDIKSLIRKRKLELEANDLISPHRNETSKTIRKASSDTPLVMEKTSLSTNALANYLSVRRGEVKPQKSEYFSMMAVTECPKILTPPNASKATLNTTFRPSLPAHLMVPAPNTTPPSVPHPFVVSAAFLANRRLSRQIRRFFPSAELIERDFNLYHDRAQRPQSRSTAVPTNASTMADEADIIISPSTGLIWTTLQKIRQRSLPGQEAKSAVRDRIIGASPRYDRLLVLASEDRDSLNSSDCEVFCGFMAFCSALRDEVQVIFIGGGNDELAKWIVAMMVKHSIPDVQLIQDETIWEIFLRRAGMNAFAAQVILGKLKAPDHDDGRRVADFGLVRFVRMPYEERVALFEKLFGGRRLLSRVSSGLDSRW